jgi:antitoxin component HigA of HigAB toxin-antitoxin module
MGYSVYGEDIYVDESDYQKALDIISVLSTEAESTEPDTNETDSTESDTNEVIERIEEEYESTPFFKASRNVIRIILAIQVVLALLIYILTKQ